MGCEEGTVLQGVLGSGQAVARSGVSGLRGQSCRVCWGLVRLWPGLGSVGCEEGTVQSGVCWGLVKPCGSTQCSISSEQSSQAGREIAVASAETANGGGLFPAKVPCTQDRTVVAEVCPDAGRSCWWPEEVVLAGGQRRLFLLVASCSCWWPEEVVLAGGQLFLLVASCSCWWPEEVVLDGFLVLLFVGWLLNVPTTCQCISGTDLLRQFYVLPH